MSIIVQKYGGSSLSDIDRIKSELSKKFGPKISFIEDLSAVSLIGEGLSRDNLILQNTLELIESYNIKLFSIATTSFRISFLIKKVDANNFINILHKKWIEGFIEVPSNI